MIGPRITITKKENTSIRVDLAGGTLSFLAQIKKGGAEAQPGIVSMSARGHNYREMVRALLDVNSFEVDGGCYRPAPKNGLNVRPENLIIRG